MASKSDLFFFFCEQIWNGYSSEKTKFGNWPLSCKRSNTFALLTYFCPSFCTFWNFNDFSPSSLFNMCCIRSRLHFSDHFWCCYFFFFLFTFWTRCNTASVTSKCTRYKRFIDSTFDFPVKYKAITLSGLNSRIPFFLNAIDQNAFVSL